MKRLILVCLFVLTSFAAWVPGIAAAGSEDDLPKSPQAKGDGLEFSVQGAILDDRFGSPLNWGANEDGRLFLLVTLEVSNTSSESKTLNSNNFRIVDGIQFIAADDGLSKRPKELGIPAMGDVLGDELGMDDTKLYILGWRLEPAIDEYVLDIDYGSAKTIDLQPWLDLDIDPGDLRPDQRSGGSSGASNRPSSRPTATVATTNDDEVTDDEQDYLDDVEDDGTKLSDSFDEIGDLFGQAGDDPTLIFDPSWQLDTATQLAVWQSVHTHALTLEPSDRQQPIQDVWLELTGLVSDAADDIAVGIDTIDSTLLDSGTAKINEATLLVSDLGDLIDDFTDDPASFEGSSSGSSGGASSDGQLITECSLFADYDEAQVYYANNPDAQPYIDPDFDGQACEVFFGRG